MKTYKNAFTIVEFLIVMTIFGLFLTMAGTLCINGMKSFKKSGNKLTVQQEAQMAIDRLWRELNESYEGGIKIETSEENEGTPGSIWDAICFPTSRNNNDATGGTAMANGKLKWNRYVVYFKKTGTKELYRRVIEATNHPLDPLYPEAMTNGEVEDFISPLSPLNCTTPYSVTSGKITNDRKIAREIYNINFSFYNSDPQFSLVTMVRISVEARVKTGINSEGEDLYENTIITTYVKPTNK
jgi:prepilin-type N-terminal cleavage/methylation domain-containing protein